MTDKKRTVAVNWDKPENDDGSPYQSLKHYESHHNVTGVPSPLIVDAEMTDAEYELPEGSYYLGLQAVNTEGHKSAKVVQTFDVGNVRINPEARRKDYGVCVGGIFSTNSFITSSGVFTLEKQDGFSFIGSGTPDVVTKIEGSGANKYSQDCSTIASLNFSSFGELEGAVKCHYMLFDASDTSNPWKLVKYEDNVYSTTNNLGLPYWYDTGTGNTTPESTFVTQTGTASIAANSTKVIGNGTDFGDEYAADDIIYFSSTKAAIVNRVESDTVLYIDRVFTAAVSNSAIKKQGLSIDINYDSIIYGVRNDGGTFSIHPILLTVDESVYNRSRLAKLSSAPNLLNFDSTSTLTTSYSNIVLTANGEGFISPKFKITGSGFSNSEISQSAVSYTHLTLPTILLV